MLIGLHKYIGYEIHERATRPNETGAELDRGEYTKRVDLFLRSKDPYSPDAERRADIASITTEAGERLVLIVQPTADRFGFELRPIQEFFAALHLCDTARDSRERYRSSSRGDFHPPALTDPGVNLSIHRALVILVTRTWGPTPNGRRLGGAGE
jgi:hypothetical protein